MTSLQGRGVEFPLKCGSEHSRYYLVWWSLLNIFTRH